MRIAIIDYGMGNLRSVEKAFHVSGAPDAFVTDDPEAILNADKAVLPGDGAFDATIEKLEQTGMGAAVKQFVKTGRAFLGICVGMQALFTRSEEGTQGIVGLNLVPGTVRRFQGSKELKVPQIGWNCLDYPRDSALFDGVDEGVYAYFLHSYYCVPDDPSVTTAVCLYEVNYCAGLEYKNIHATQFHPEKSAEAGLQILRNFAEL